MWDYRRAKPQGQGSVMRSRARFSTPWRLTTMIEVDTVLVSVEQLTAALDVSGRYIGLGDYRPEGGGVFGRFLPKLKEM